MRNVVVAALLFALPLPAAAQPKTKYPPVKMPDGEPKPKDDAPADAPKPEPPKAEPKAAAPAPSPSPSPGGEESVASRNTKSMWLALGFGPSVGIVGCVRRLCNLEQSYTQFKLSEDLGWHVSGSDGFALGANLQQAFNSDFYRFSAAFKLWWDAPLDDELALYLSPMTQFGYAFQVFTFGELGTIIDHAFNVQAGLGIKIVLLDSAMLYVRPITADINIGPDGLALFYDIAVGGGFTFDP